MTHAAIAMHGNDAAAAIRLLQPSESSEIGTNASLWPAYLRGLAYLRQQAGKEAALEFQKILDHKGANWGPLYALSYVGLARATALHGDNAHARKCYEEFLSLWKDADPDVPILTQVRNEYARLIGGNSFQQATGFRP